MNYVRLWCLFGLVSLGTPAVSEAQHPSKGSAESTVTALELRWLRSQQTNDAALVAPLFADKFVGTDSDGEITNKRQALAEAKATKWNSVEYENVQVTIYGNTAIATGGFIGKGTDPSGKPIDAHDRWTDTWIKMSDGHWQCVASQHSPVKAR
jgi:uncharacterized protein (TIGR02246 family)